MFGIDKESLQESAATREFVEEKQTEIACQMLPLAFLRSK